MTYITFESLRSVALEASAVEGARARSRPPKSSSPRRVSDEPLPQASPSESSPSPDSSLPRDEVLRLGAHVGRLCSAFMTHAPRDPPRDALSPEMTESESFPPTLADSGFWAEKSEERNEIAAAMGWVLLALFVVESACRMDLRVCILKKMELNNRKYPAKLCKGKSGKYTAYSDQTGITKTEGQSTVHIEPDERSHPTSSSDGDRESNNGSGDAPSPDVATADTVEGITLRIRRFATDRSWCRYHTPRNIVLALMGELGELAELFQWKGDAPGGAPVGLVGWSEVERDTVGQELADVAIYLLRLADVCGVDVGKEAMKAATKRGSNVGNGEDYP